MQITGPSADHPPSADTPESNRKVEILALTGLRAVAAILVVLSHTGFPANAPSLLQSLAARGYIGVPLFFMLSGFVLAYNYPTLRFRDGRLTARFYVARIARVMPLYWAMLLYCAALYAAVDHEQYPRAFLLNVFAVQTWSDDLLVAQSRYNGPGWSIGVEMFFYALFPLMMPVFLRFGRATSIRGLLGYVFLAAVASAGLLLWFHSSGWTLLPAEDGRSAHRWLYRNPLPHLLGFTVGIATALLLPWAKGLRDRTHHVAQAAVALFVLAYAELHSGSSAFWAAASFGPLWIVPFAVLIGSLGTGRGWLASVLSFPIFVSVGAASYALYITHRWFVWQLRGHDEIVDGGRFDGYLGLIMVLGILLLIGEGAHRYIEQPCRKWIVRQSDRWLPPPIAPDTEHTDQEQAQV